MAHRLYIGSIAVDYKRALIVRVALGTQAGRLCLRLRQAPPPSREKPSPFAKPRTKPKRSNIVRSASRSRRAPAPPHRRHDVAEAFAEARDLIGGRGPAEAEADRAGGKRRLRAHRGKDMRMSDLARRAGGAGRGRKAGKVEADHQSLSRDARNGEAQCVRQSGDPGPENDGVRRSGENMGFERVSQAFEPFWLRIDLASRRANGRAEPRYCGHVLGSCPKPPLLSAAAQDRVGHAERPGCGDKRAGALGPAELMAREQDK